MLAVLSLGVACIKFTSYFGCSLHEINRYSLFSVENVMPVYRVVQFEMGIL